MKYDISSLMVKVTEQHMPLWQFLVRLCGIVGGIFSTTGRWPLFQKHCLATALDITERKKHYYIFLYEQICTGFVKRAYAHFQTEENILDFSPQTNVESCTFSRHDQ